MQYLDGLLAHRKRAVLTHKDMVGPSDGRTWTTSPAEIAIGGSPGLSEISRRPSGSMSLATPVMKRPIGSSTRTFWPRVTQSGR
jgi:hypothetical protein